MKKMMIICIVIVGFLMINYTNLFAVAKTKVVTAYYCDFGSGHCLKFQGKDDIWLTIPSVLKTITIRVPAVAELVPDAPEGTIQLTNFFYLQNLQTRMLGLV